MTQIFRIVLRDANRYDTYEAREFDIALNGTFPIGRASKNATKRELVPAAHNAFIDSPVISREHAVLSVSPGPSDGSPAVYITDSGSMHGTILNGRNLVPNTSELLKSGDELQFGTDVNRNEEYFKAHTYIFESRLSRPFSLGFTVPDDESDEEVVEEHGASQLDPLVIDSDAASDRSDEDQAEVTIMPTVQQVELNAAVTPDDSFEEYPESATHSNIAEAGFSDNEGCTMDISLSPSESEDEGEHASSNDSEGADLDGSELGYDSQPEVPESEDEEIQRIDEAEVIRSDTPTTTREEKSSVTMTNPWSAQATLPSPPNVQPAKLHYAEKLVDHEGIEPSHFGMFNHSQRLVDNPWSNNITFENNTAPSLPPPCAILRPAVWANLPLETPEQTHDQHDWLMEEMPSPTTYFSTNYGERPALFSPAPVPQAPETRVAQPSVYTVDGEMGPFTTAARLQTPPPVASSDIDGMTPPQPGRRTKVSIEEIVEEQPLSPISVSGLKRKADVLDQEEPLVDPKEVEKVVVDEAVAVEETSIATSEQTIPDSQVTDTAIIIARRPKKQPRSIMRKVFEKATYPLLGATGAVVSFALLSTLPDTFFT